MPTTRSRRRASRAAATEERPTRRQRGARGVRTSAAPVRAAPRSAGETVSSAGLRRHEAAVGVRMVVDVECMVARGIEREGLVGALVEDGDDEAAGAAAPEQRDVEAVGCAMGELGHVICSCGNGGKLERASRTAVVAAIESAGVSWCGRPYGYARSDRAEGPAEISTGPGGGVVRRRFGRRLRDAAQSVMRMAVDVECAMVREVEGERPGTTDVRGDHAAATAATPGERSVEVARSGMKAKSHFI